MPAKQYGPGSPANAAANALRASGTCKKLAFQPNSRAEFCVLQTNRRYLRRREGETAIQPSTLTAPPLMHACRGTAVAPPSWFHRAAVELSRMHQCTLGAFFSARFHITAALLVRPESTTTSALVHADTFHVVARLSGRRCSLLEAAQRSLEPVGHRLRLGWGRQDGWQPFLPLQHLHGP